MLKTENIFPYDLNDGKKKIIDNQKFPTPLTVEHLDRIETHPDRVIRQELFTNFDKPVKADIKKSIPG